MVALTAGEILFEETFTTKEWSKKWVHSQFWGNGRPGKFTHTAGQWHANKEEAKGIGTMTDVRNYGITHKFPEPISTWGKTFVIQFSVKHEKADEKFCGGGYIKLAGSDINQTHFGSKSPFKLMFGPDLCHKPNYHDTAKVQVIFEHKGNPAVRREPIPVTYDEKNRLTHLYTLVVNPDNTYEVFIDKKSKAKGGLIEDFSFPGTTYDDPVDKRPEDWVRKWNMEIDDPLDTEPEWWDNRKKILDPQSTKPDIWNEAEDGEWKANLIMNPAWRGAWKARKIPNPNYKGEWGPRQLPNDDYTPEVHGLDDIAAVGFELWIFQHGSIFDNVFLGTSLSEAFAHADEHWGKIIVGEKEAQDAFDIGNAPPEEPEEDDTVYPDLDEDL